MPLYICEKAKLLITRFVAHGWEQTNKLGWDNGHNNMDFRKFDKNGQWRFTARVHLDTGQYYIW